MPYITSWERDSIAKGLEQGLQQGLEKVRKTAKTLFIMGLTVEQVIEATELSPEEVLAIKAEVDKQSS